MIDEVLTARQAARLLGTRVTDVVRVARWYAIPYRLAPGVGHGGQVALYDAAAVRRVVELRRGRAARLRWYAENCSAGVWHEPTICPRCSDQTWLQEMRGGNLRLVQLEDDIPVPHDCHGGCRVPMQPVPARGSVAFRVGPTAARPAQ